MTNGASVTVNETDLTFEDTATFTIEPPNHVNGVLALTVQAVQDGQVVWAAGGYPIPDSFILGPSPSWQGGAAHGTAILYTFNPQNGKSHTVATDDFEIGA